jgi:hypothetical protein
MEYYDLRLHIIPVSGATQKLITHPFSEFLGILESLYILLYNPFPQKSKKG